MLSKQVVIFYQDDIDKIVQECLTYPYCTIIVAVPSFKIKDIALNFLEHINEKDLASRFIITTNRAKVNFINGTILYIIDNNMQSRGYRASKIYCSPDTSIEAYFYIFRPLLRDYNEAYKNEI